jgi:lipopolysaccharide/colanic/teichoic acid biosynthesis glycosyltransferase
MTSADSAIASGSMDAVVVPVVSPFQAIGCGVDSVVLAAASSTAAKSSPELTAAQPDEQGAKQASSAPDSAADFAELLRCNVVELPGTEWLTRLANDQPRENVRCLPLSFRIIKRLFDVVGALALMVATAPLVIMAALLIKATSPGPILYSQTRVGLNLRAKKRSDRRAAAWAAPPETGDRRVALRDRRELRNYGRPFTIYKLRTMRTDAEKCGAQFAQKGDARVTWIGRWLRRTRVDELPQLWNVLRGDMSLIGPRPERPEFMEKLQQHIPHFVDRLGLRPGLTGVAQVVNGYDNELEGFRRKISYDLLYLQNCSFWNDCKIMFRTVRVVIRGDGAL